MTGSTHVRAQICGFATLFVPGLLHVACAHGPTSPPAPATPAPLLVRGAPGFRARIVLGDEELARDNFRDLYVAEPGPVGSAACERAVRSVLALWEGSEFEAQVRERCAWRAELPPVAQRGAPHHVLVARDPDFGEHVQVTGVLEGALPETRSVELTSYMRLPSRAECESAITRLQKRFADQQRQKLDDMRAWLAQERSQALARREAACGQARAATQRCAALDERLTGTDGTKSSARLAELTREREACGFEQTMTERSCAAETNLLRAIEERAARTEPPLARDVRCIPG